MNLQLINNLINVIPNFPREGIFFRDISPLLANNEIRELAFDMLSDLVKNVKIDYIAGIDSRGFIFGIALAQRLKCGFIMMRKPNKLPNSIQIPYGIEYGKDILTLQDGLIPHSKYVLIVDDLLATGGSILAGCELIEKIGCNVAGCLCLIELIGLIKREKLLNYKIFSLIRYPTNSANKFISKDEILISKDNEILNSKKVEYFPLEQSINDNRIIIFSHTSMKLMADKIVASSEHFRTGIIHYNNLKYLENKRVVFIASLYDRTHILEELTMIMCIPKQFIKSLDVILPYFTPVNMEKIYDEEILDTSKTIAKILSTCLPITKQGLPIIHIFDAHTIAVKYYFPDNVIVRMESSISLLKEKISKNTTIVFPDDGSVKRFKLMFIDYKIIICSRVRDGDNIYIKIVDHLNWPIDDSKCMDDVIIIDDIVQSGNTIEECRKTLINNGAKKISAYVIHAVFFKRSYRKFLGNTLFHKFYITNSIPEIANLLEEKEPFEVIHLENMLVDNLLTSLEI